MTFQIRALPYAPFRALFDMTDTDLAAVGARRMTVDVKPGYPCRVSLRDAEIGETVILTNYVHQPEDTPYRASHAIFIWEGAPQAKPEPGEIPEVLSSRLISLRVFDEAHMMIAADVLDGTRLAEAMGQHFDNPNAAYIHLHNAKPGCFAASVTRA